ncbi:MAG TPA: glyceraldehyde 3-phosphate dehydrogenase NAD-binding domain-containing protein [Thermoanaerobaculia bacterium]|nr:glyceraldehyde 3-phosphate dehydrogenase NAD-binding domain-containing protein [Thermoanaerobaculia bacterium]
MRVGLMGFGRIGRSLFRILYNHPDLEVRAISEVADPEGMEYLLKFDTILGRFPDEVSIRDGHLYVIGKQIPVVAGEAPGDVPWGDLGVDVVIEATSRFRSRAELAKHLEAGAKRVVLCSPPADPPDLTVVMGVNDSQLRPEHKIVSNGSVTAHCAAPILKILHEAFGVERAFLTTVHAYTNQQRLADVPSEDKRRGRAAAENIIPQETNAGEVLMELLPDLKGRISGLAMNVPVRNGSVVDLVCWHERPVTVTAINEVVRTAAASERWRRYVEFEDEPIVSSDSLSTHYSSVFDSLSTMVIGDRLSKTLSWFDNGWGYSHRVVDLIQRFAEMEREVSR